MTTATATKMSTDWMTAGQPLTDGDPTTEVLSEKLTRDVRQRQLIPPGELRSVIAMVVGVGAIGRQVAVQLAAIGVPKLILVDDDVVGVENLGCQAYFESDVGQNKVDATAALCQQLNPQIDVIHHVERFKRSSLFQQINELEPGQKVVVFSAVDSMASRKFLWSTCKPAIQFWVDGRMNAEVMRVLASGDPLMDKDYEKSLFSDGEAFQGSCTARSTVYTANIAAGLMVSQFTRWLRGHPVDQDVMLNLGSMELAVTDPPI